MPDIARQPIRILMVGGHKLVRQGIRMLIESRPDMRVVGEAGNRTEAFSIAAREQPDIVLLDLDLHGTEIIDLFPELRQKAPGARALVITGERDPELHKQAVLRGALGLVLKDRAADVLLRAIERVYEGEAWLDHTMTAEVINHLSRPRPKDKEEAKIADLTRREREIISIASQGLKNSQIAAKLFISEATVRNHLTSILSKLGLSDRFELALYSYRYGLGRPPQQESKPKIS